MYSNIYIYCKRSSISSTNVTLQQYQGMPRYHSGICLTHLNKEQEQHADSSFFFFFFKRCDDGSRLLHIWWFLPSGEALSTRDMKESSPTLELTGVSPNPPQLHVDTSSNNHIQDPTSGSLPNSTKSGASTPGSTSSKKSQRLHDALRFSAAEQDGQVVHRTHSAKTLLGGSPKPTAAGTDRTTTL